MKFGTNLAYASVREISDYGLCFEVISTFRNLELKASTEEERQMWIEAIKFYGTKTQKEPIISVCFLLSLF